MNQPNRQLSTGSGSRQALARQDNASQDVALMDEPISDEDLKQYLRSYRSEYADQLEPDLVEGRFRVLMQQPLEAFNSTLGKAYKAKDERGEQRDYYALVCPIHLPYRTRTVEAIRSLSHPNFLALAAAGACYISQLREVRYVCVFEQPKGVKLSQVSASQGALNDRFVSEQVIAPINQIILAFAERGMNHGSINLENIYFGDKLLLGECVSEPSGLSQPFIYEPLDRILSSEMGKGNGDILADVFALGVVVLYLLTAKKMPDVERRVYVQQVILQGSYTVLADRHNFSPMMSDFLRGTLNDEPKERWTPQIIQSWLAGKRFNLVPPAPPREAARPYVFKEREFVSRRALAHAFHESWEDAIDNIREGKLQRWAHMSLHRPELGEQIEKIVQYAGSSRTVSAKANNELVARTIIALDPSGPVRLRDMSANVDGLGSMLAEAMTKDKQDSVQFLFEALDDDLPNFWADQQKDVKNQKVSTVLWRLQKVRIMMRLRSLGFGPERVLYEINPTMSCQSDILKDRHITDYTQLLHTLDAIATEYANSHSPLDRHSAAFLAAKMGINKEIFITELTRFADLSSEPKLIMLRLLLTAQDRIGGAPLRGLCHWMAITCLPLLDRFHNRKIRKTLEEEIKRSCITGQLAGMAKVLFEPMYYLRDQLEFQRASTYYRLNEQKIRDISDPRYLLMRGKKLGQQISTWTAFLICLLVVYSVTEKYMHL